MKKSFLIIPVFLIGIFLTTINSNSQCPPNSPCQSEPWQYASTTFTLPGYEDCPIDFDYMYRYCIDNDGNQRVEYRLYSFYYPEDDPNCADLNDNLTLPNGDPNWEFMKWIFRTANTKLPSVLFMNSYNAAGPMEKQMFECPNIQTRYSGVFRSCAKIGLIIIGYTQLGEFRIPIYKAVIEPCNDEICCEEVQEICIDHDTGELIIQKQTYNYVSGECEINPDPIPNAEITFGCFKWCTD